MFAGMSVDIPSLRVRASARIDFIIMFYVGGVDQYKYERKKQRNRRVRVSCGDI